MKLSQSRLNLSASVKLLVVLLIPLATISASANPPIYENDYGSVLTTLTGEDDEAELVTIPFSFPFAGSSFTNIYVGTNGAIALGGIGEADDYPSGDEFIDTVDPMIAVFWSDMDLSSMGTIHANLSLTRAVFTWNGIGSFENESAPFTFQLQLFASGEIIFGYNGISPVNADNIDEVVHVGLTEGNLSAFPAESDYSAQSPFVTGRNVLELFDYDPAEGFDLDQANVIFTPVVGGDGYAVTVARNPASVPDGGSSALLLAMGLLGLKAFRRK